MGYDLHITRADDWTDSEAHPITLEEWKAVVLADPELELTGSAEAATPDGVLKYENAGLTVWHPDVNAEPVWFDYRHGRVVVKNPDAAVIAKMVALASRLNARVVGDDGEAYGSTPQLGAGPGFVERLSGWLVRLLPKPRVTISAIPFQPGDRVRDALGNSGIVVAVDPTAQHGLGRVVVRYDDGRELTFAGIAHGLAAEPKE